MESLANGCRVRDFTVLGFKGLKFSAVWLPGFFQAGLCGFRLDDLGLLGGSRVVISRVMSGVTILITHKSSTPKTYDIQAGL